MTEKNGPISNVIQDAIITANMKSVLKEMIANMNSLEKKLALFEFQDNLRDFWHYIPIERHGLTIENAETGTVRKMWGLISLALSQKGLDLVKKIMKQELILKDIEDRTGKNFFIRSDERYWFSVYGSPEENKISWRFEGHHVSLNCLIVNDNIRITPLFFGANPANVKEGEHKSLRILNSIEDLARDMLLSFDRTQLNKALIDDKAPWDLLTTNQRHIVLGNPVGISILDMSSKQQKLFMQLIKLYFDTTTKNISGSLLTNIENSSQGSIYFAWAGGLYSGMPHYYCIQGGNMLIEYDCVQDDANHIHSVARDAKGDFGNDILMDHRLVMH